MTLTPKLELDAYRQIVVMTGAGISVASGLPTYRGSGGLWREVEVEKHATAAAIAAAPARVWQFFAGIRAQVAAAAPNAAHSGEPKSCGLDCSPRRQLRCLSAPGKMQSDAIRRSLAEHDFELGSGRRRARRE